ncbi:hypothetical protein QBC43DRAFT_327936 [Cladorrhinum sp. PSN259]|nr:hypothetical protein QBC43DRAFT_327936 [Cladorrhinum sp. PSN259]
MGTQPDASDNEKLFSRNRLVAFFYRQRSVLGADKNEIQTRLLERCSDWHVGKLSQEESNACLLHLRTIADGRWVNDEWDNLIDDSYELGDTIDDKIIQLCSEVVGVLRDHGPISISRIIQTIQSRDIIRKDRDLSYDSSAHRLVFALLGWLSFLYVPSARQEADELRIDLQITQPSIRGSAPVDMVGRPLDELLRSFGELLPQPQRPRLKLTESRSSQVYQTQVPNSGSNLEVSHMNVATLKDMANMKIIWVDTISEHLQFDPTTPSVSLFKCPSFCKLQKHSNQSALAIILREFYPQHEEEPAESAGFTVQQLINEVMLSYSLLFKAERRARKVYQRHERKRAALGTKSSIAAFIKDASSAGGHVPVVVDPCLDELCGNSISSSVNLGAAVRESYDANIEFPIFKARLERIQQYVRDIQPNRFMSLWRDQRDLRLWYTIWVVIILSVIGIIIAAVSMFLAAAQVNLAKMAYKLQLQQGAQATETPASRLR